MFRRPVPQQPRQDWIENEAVVWDKCMVLAAQALSYGETARDSLVLSRALYNRVLGSAELSPTSCKGGIHSVSIGENRCSLLDASKPLLLRLFAYCLTSLRSFGPRHDQFC